MNRFADGVNTVGGEVNAFAVEMHSNAVEVNAQAVEVNAFVVEVRSIAVEVNDNAAEGNAFAIDHPNVARNLGWGASRTSRIASAYTCAHTVQVSFEWVPQKAASNAKKHGIEFADAVAVFDDGSAVTIADEDSEDEERWVTIGVDAFQRLLVVVYTWRETNIRMISARMVTRREQATYRG